MWLFLYYLFSVVNGIILPIGNTYCTKITIPLLGCQYVESKVISKKRVEILLKGKLNHKGEAIINEKDNINQFLLNKEFDDFLKNQKIDFKLINYDIKKDQVNFKINIKPIFFSKIITLKNINKLNES